MSAPIPLRPSGSPEALQIKAAFFRKGITIKALALQWGMSYAAVSRAVNGQKPHSPIRQSVTELIGFWPWPEDEAKQIWSFEDR